MTAALAFGGATDGAAFRTFAEEVLAPTLAEGDVVVLDNLAAHKDPDAVRAIRARGAEVLYLPAYSPDLNPIEKGWSKAKAHLRAAEARTQGALDAALGEALRAITPADCRAFFASCGYHEFATPM